MQGKDVPSFPRHSTQAPGERLARRLRAALLTHEITAHLDAMGVVHQAVEDPAGGRGFADLLVPSGERLISENFYRRGKTEYDFTALRALPKVRLAAQTKSEKIGAAWRLSTELHNPSADPALMVRIKAVRSNTSGRTRPALYSDN